MRRPSLVLSTALLALAALPAGALAAAAGPGQTFLTGGLDLPLGAVVGAESGTLDIGGAIPSAVSDDGRYVAFTSKDDAFDPAADPDVVHVFRKDRLTGAVVLVSRATGTAGAAGDRPTYSVAISDDGARVAFATGSALDPADQDAGGSDVYVRDVAAATTTLASVGEGGRQTGIPAATAEISGDGRWVPFTTNEALDPVNDTNNTFDVYRRDLATGRTLLASAVDGAAAAGRGASTECSISDDGRWLAFSSLARDLVPGFNGTGTVQHVFLRDLANARTYLVSAAHGTVADAVNGNSGSPDIAGAPASLADVSVAFTSAATNLAAPGADASFEDSIYVRRMSLASSLLVSVNDAGQNADSSAIAASISDDGTRIAFESGPANFGGPPGSIGTYQRTYLRDIASARTLLVTPGGGSGPSLSGDGAFTTWTGVGAASDADPDLPAVLGRRYAGGALGAAELVSRPPGSAPLRAPALRVRSATAASRVLSANGRYLLFVSDSARLPGADRYLHAYRRDLETGEIVLASRGDGANGTPAYVEQESPSISADGTRVAFATRTRIDPSAPADVFEVYVRDLTTGSTQLVSRADGAGGAVADGVSYAPQLSADGRRVVFFSTARSLGGDGVTAHAYVRDLAGGRTLLADRATGAAGAVADAEVRDAAPSGDGRLVAFSSPAGNLDPAKTTRGRLAVYVRDVVAGTTTLASRRSGLAGDAASDDSWQVAISDDGARVAFVAEDDQVAPEGGPWGTADQVVVRTLATGANVLVSRGASGAAGSDDSQWPTLSADGSVAAFETTAPNLIAGLGASDRPAVMVHLLASTTLVAPPPFGVSRPDGGLQGARAPSLSADGRCLAFTGVGHNTATGPAGDIVTSYGYTVSGACPRPPAPTSGPRPEPRLDAPRVSRASLSHKRFRVGRRATARSAAVDGAASAKRRRARRAPVGTTVRFRLSTQATVTLAIERKAAGRRVGRACRRPSARLRRKPRCVRWVKSGTLTRRAVRAGARRIAFSGRVGRKALKPGTYRMRVRARNSAGASKWVRLSFTVVKR